MTKSATDVMQEILFSAVVDALDALKSASRGVPNTLLRDIGAVHVNATFADLPKELQTAILASVRTAFNRLNKEGYSVAPMNAPPVRRPPPRPETAAPRHGDKPRRPQPPRGRTPPPGPRGPKPGPKGS
jgi:hypothetical protein